MSLFVEQLWRYPVKTLAGERLETAELTADGIPGDRIVHVRGPVPLRSSRLHSRRTGGSQKPVALYERWEKPQ